MGHFLRAIECPMRFTTHDTSGQAVSVTHSALMVPRLSLASCVRGYVTRSTLGCDLPLTQRHNYFFASPLCTITFLLQGASLVIRRGNAAVVEPIPSIAFSGPHTVPLVSVNPGPVQSLMISLTPAAVVAMTHMDLSTVVNRIVPLETVLDQSWQTMAQAVQVAPDEVVAVRCIEDFLESRWSAVSHSAMPNADRLRYWAENLALRASTSGVGSSLRQIERRIKQWAGLPMRDLRRMARAEESFFRVREALEADALDWAAAAADGGFADQAHLCRETRRVTGLSPNQLKRAIESEEGFWLYRL